MRRVSFFSFSALAAVVLAVACNDDGLGPERYGSIVLRIVPAGSPATTPRVTEPVANQSPRSASGKEAGPPRKPGMEARDGAEPDSAKTPPIDIARSPTAAAALERVQVSVDGPTPKSIDLTLNTDNDHWEGTVDGLDVGAYTVAVKGYVNSQVDSYGQTSGVQVRGGQETTASITNWGTFQPSFTSVPGSPTQMLRFTVQFQAISTATGYELQWADNGNFSNPQSINTTQTSLDVGQVPGPGEYHLRVRASNGEVTAGRWSDEQVVVVEADTIGNSLGPAAYIGFGDGINGRRPTTNIVPSDDEDWYRFQACRADTVTAETFAQRLTPASDLNTVLALRSVSGDSVVASNDDADGTDSRLDGVILPSSGEYVVVVSGTGGTIGAYELDLNLAPGEFNTGSDCLSAVDHVGVTPGAAEVPSIADTVRFSAVAYDVADVPIPTQPAITWGLSDSTVASIDADGLVTASAEGVTDVVATMDGVSSAGTFTVAQVVTSFTLTPDSALAVSIGEQVQYDGSALDANGYVVASATISWSSDDEAIGTVDTSGLVDAVTNGSTWIRASTASVSDSAVFAVEQAVDSIAVAQDTTLHSLGQTAQLSAEAFDALGVTFETPPAFSWSSSDDLIVTVDGTGLITAQDNGSVTITASADGVDGTAAVAVSQVAATIVVTPSGQSISTAGGAAAYAAEAQDSLGSAISGASITWTSLNPAVATVASGTATAVASGQAIVQAEANGVRGYATVTVGATASPQANLFTSQATASSAGFNLWPQAATNIWAVGHDGVILHWDGSNWSSETSGTADSLNAAWGTSDTLVFAVGNNGTIVMTEDGGANWQTMSTPTPERMWGVWGAAPNDVFAVGTGGVIVHYDGSAWTSMTSNTVEDLRAVWGTAWDDVYAVGVNSTLLHYDGSSWGSLSGAPAGDYAAIWGIGGDDYWIAGATGLVAHYTGSWSTESVPTASNIRGISGSASDDVYAVGGDGLVLRFDGSTWDSLPAPTTELLFDVRAAPSGDVFVGGANGVVLRGYRGAQTAFLSEPPSAVDPRTNFSTSVEFRDAGGSVITEPTAGTIGLGLSNNAGTVIHLSGGGPGGGQPAMFWRVDATTPIKGDSVEDVSGAYLRIWGSTYDPGTAQVLASGIGSGTYALLSVDPIDGAVAVIGTTPDLLKGLAWVNGVLWGPSASSATMYEVDPATAGIASIGTVAGTTINGFNGLAVDPTDGTVFAVANPGGPGTQDRTLVTIDPATLVATVIGPLEQWGVSSLAFMDDGTLLATTGSGAPIPEYVWVVDKTDATMRPMLDATTPTVDGISIAAVPAHLSGTLNIASSSGVATFGDLQLDAPASGYTLVASYPYLADAFTGGFDVNIGPAPTTPLYVDITPQGGTIIGINDTLQLTATPYLYAGGSYQVASGATVTWSSADSAVAIAAQDGVVTGYATGVARIDVDEDGGNALSASVDVTVDPSFTGSISATTADFADQLTLTPGSGVTWTGAETVTIGGELPYIESQDASQIVLRVPSVPVGDAEVVIGDQEGIGFTQYDTIQVTSVYVRAANPLAPGGDAARITNDTTIWLSLADSMTSVAFPPGEYSFWTLSPTQNMGYQASLDWQGSHDLDFVVVDSAFTSYLDFGGATYENPETSEFAISANTTARLAVNNWNAGSGEPQVMARLQVTLVPSVGTSMVAGSDHSCMLDLSGNAYCWGSNQSGQLGVGDYGTVYSTTPVAVTGGVTFTALTAGWAHTCGLTESGDAYCWGADWSGQIGDGAAPAGVSAQTTDGALLADPRRLPRDTTLEQPVLPPMFSPTNSEGTADVMPTLVLGGHTFTQLSAGDSHTCGVTTGGDIYCWGYNYYGQLGDGTNTGSPSPVAVVNPGVTFTQVAGGAYHTCALTNSGAVYCWGWNNNGQLGNNSQIDENMPVYVGTGYTSVIAGYYHSCALDGSGDLWCWGYNSSGAFGNGGNTSPALIPTAGASGYGFVRITSGPDAFATCGITAANVAYCWGSNANGVLGDGTTSTTYSPVAVSGGHAFVSIALGYEHSCGATTTGDAYCWGSWELGELGNGAIVPVTPQPVASSTGFTEPTVGFRHTCALGGTDAYCWGQGGGGRLGTGSSTDETTPTLVTGGLAFASLSAGQYHTCSVTTTSVGYCWGDNYYGALGDATGISSTSPVPVAGGLTWDQINTNGYGRTTCGLATTGVVYCWGRNDYGQLGHGTVGDSAFAPDSVHTGFTFQQVATGGNHACALTSTGGGDIWCWGRNAYGQLGDGTVTDSPNPVQVDNLGGTLSFTSVSAGQRYTCATTTGNETYCWGQGSWGQLGNGSYSDLSTPTLVSGGLTFSDVQGGVLTTCGVAGGAGYCWGYNGYGQVGNGTLSYEPEPALISGGLTFNRVAASYHSCGTTAGDMYCWGDNRYGQLGLGWLQRELSPVSVAGGVVVRAPSMMPASTDQETKSLPLHP